MPDLILRNGTIIDGTGAPGHSGSVAITGDRITQIGDLTGLTAAREIDVNGRVVCPGLIDVHNHSDGWLIRESNFTPKTTQGFTTEVLMADGIGYAPVNDHTVNEWLFYLRGLNGLRMGDWSGWRSFSEYLEAIHGRTAQNACSHLPYANLRAMACGFGRGAVDDFQMREIKRQICIGMEAGAVGVSTGLDYIVQHFSTTDELAEALSAMAPYDGLYVTHVRYKMGLLPAVKEAVEIGRRAGVRVHISHLKGQAAGQVDELLEYIDTTARHEVDFSFDLYPYQPGSTMLNYLVPYECWEDGPLAAASRLADPVMQSKFAAGLDAYRLPLDRLRIAWVPGKENSHLQGLTLAQFIEQSGRSPLKAITDLLIEERFAPLLVFDEGDDRLVEPLLAHDLFTLGTDGIYTTDGPVHPRVYGSVGRLFGPLVRDRKLMSLEQAVHHSTGYSAERFRLTDRGVLRVGAFADVVVFDPATITDHATFDDPRQPTVGVENVIVNGELILADSQPLEFGDSAPGRFLKC